jgi:hypothetical protein
MALSPCVLSALSPQAFSFREATFSMRFCVEEPY